MPLPKDLDPYANPRAFYGAELRRLREAAGLSQNELGERAFCSGTYIGLFEAAERRPQVEISRALDALLGNGEHLQRLCRLARTSKVAGYFADAAELQQRAVSIAEFSSLVVPGLLRDRVVRPSTHARCSPVRFGRRRRDPCAHADRAGGTARLARCAGPLGHRP